MTDEYQIVIKQGENPPHVRVQLNGRPYRIGTDPGKDIEVGMLLATGCRIHARDSKSDIIKRALE